MNEKIAIGFTNRGYDTGGSRRHCEAIPTEHTPA